MMSWLSLHDLPLAHVSVLSGLAPTMLFVDAGVR